MNEPVFRVVEDPSADRPPSRAPRLPFSPWPGGSDRTLTCVYLALGLAVCGAALLFVSSMAGFAARAGKIAEGLRGERWTVRSAPTLDMVSTSARAGTERSMPAHGSMRSPG